MCAYKNVYTKKYTETNSKGGSNLEKVCFWCFPAWRFWSLLVPVKIDLLRGHIFGVYGDFYLFFRSPWLFSSGCTVLKDVLAIVAFRFPQGGLKKGPKMPYGVKNGHIPPKWHLFHTFSVFVLSLSRAFWGVSEIFGGLFDTFSRVFFRSFLVIF